MILSPGVSISRNIQVNTENTTTITTADDSEVVLATISNRLKKSVDSVNFCWKNLKMEIFTEKINTVTINVKIMLKILVDNVILPGSM